MEKERKEAITLNAVRMINTRLKSSMATYTGTQNVIDTAQHFFNRLKASNTHIERLTRLGDEALEENIETLEVLFKDTDKATGEATHLRLERKLKEVPSDNKFRLGWLIPILAAMFIALKTVDGLGVLIAFIALLFAIERVRLFFNANAAEASLDDLEYFWEVIQKPRYESED